MTLNKFNKELRVILESDTQGKRVKRVKDPHSNRNARKVSRSTKIEASNLIVRFIHGDKEAAVESMSSLHTKWNIINLLCRIEEITTRRYLNKVLTDQASEVLGQIAKWCRSFEEFKMYLHQSHSWIKYEPSKASIKIDSLMHL